MPDLTLIYGGTPATGGGPIGTGPRRRVTVSSSAGVTTLSVTDPETEHFGLGLRWVPIPRAGGRPLLHNAGPGNRQYRLKATLYADPPRDVAAELDALIFGHALQGQVHVAYGRLEAMDAVISDLKVTVRHRVEGSNEPYWADVDLELTDRPPEPRTVVAVPIPSAAPPAPTPPAAAPAAEAGRTYTVKRGDTLSSIAQRFYGHANRYPDIAKANGIRNPNVIGAGQVLRIP